MNTRCSNSKSNKTFIPRTQPVFRHNLLAFLTWGSWRGRCGCRAASCRRWSWSRGRWCTRRPAPAPPPWRPGTGCSCCGWRALTWSRHLELSWTSWNRFFFFSFFFFVDGQFISYQYVSQFKRCYIYFFSSFLLCVKDLEYISFLFCFLSPIITKITLNVSRINHWFYKTHYLCKNFFLWIYIF